VVFNKEARADHWLSDAIHVKDDLLSSSHQLITTP